MKNQFTVLLNGLLLALVLGFSACEGDQGEPGPAGAQGEQGAQGEKGEKGDKGDQGESGSVEAQSFGNIVVTFSGVRYDGVAFTAVQDFKYFPEEFPLYDNSFYENDGTTYFNILRQYKNQIPAANERTHAPAGNNMHIEFSHDGENITVDDFSFNTQIIDGVKAFHLDAYDTEGFEITDYAFDPSTGKLTFNFSYEFVTYYDETITVTGVVNVMLIESEPA